MFLLYFIEICQNEIRSFWIHFLDKRNMGVASCKREMHINPVCGLSFNKMMLKRAINIVYLLCTSKSKLHVGKPLVSETIDPGC